MQVWLLPSLGTAGHGKTWKVPTPEGQEAHLCRQQYRLTLTNDTNDADQTWDYKSFLLGPFKCPGCDSVTFSNRRALDLHMRKIHKAGIVECDECGRKVLDLKRHKEILHKWELIGWILGGCQYLFFVTRRFKIYSCPHCSDKYCTQEDLERHLLKVWRKTHESGFNKCKINVWGCPAQVTFVKTCSTSGGEEQHCQRSADCIRSTKRATEGTPGKTYCSATGEFLQLETKYIRLRHTTYVERIHYSWSSFSHSGERHS